MPIEINQPIPNFDFIATNDTDASFAELKGNPVVLYFYPRDNTPGCTQEGEDFRDQFTAFKKQGVNVFGISRDKLVTHKNFQAKYNFPFELITDPEEKLCQLFNVMVQKNMYGKKCRGIERSTFLIDKEGILRKEWRKVKVDGHVDEVLSAVTEL